jgi:MoxR-like ATPase
LQESHTLIHAIIDEIEKVVIGKRDKIELAMAAFLSGGHLLIEDMPGVGKTTLAKAIAQVLGLEFGRIQFTSDLLPADILGVSIYDKQQGGFHFQPGPIFAQLILADEVNRATPKAQSALLEAMEEQQVTIEGETHPLPEPFFVIATQNPTYQIGTFPLPESQLDRFLMRLSLGFPDAGAERDLLRGQDRRELLKTLPACIAPEQLTALQQATEQVHAADALLDYLQALLSLSRQSPEFATGLSPRAGLALLHGAKAWALLSGRDHVAPEDVQMVLPHVVGHRLHAADGGGSDNQALLSLLQAVPIP